MKNLLSGLLIFAGIASGNAAGTEFVDYVQLLNKDANDATLLKYLGENMQANKSEIGFNFHSNDHRINVSADFFVDKNFRVHEDKSGKVDAISFQFDELSALDFPIELPFDLSPDMSWLECYLKLQKQTDVQQLNIFVDEDVKQIVFELEAEGRNIEFTAEFKQTNTYNSMTAFRINGNSQWY